MRKYLFVCWQNQTRSPYVSRYFDNLLKRMGTQGWVASAGLAESSNKKVTKEMCNLVDMIFVMEEWMKDELVRKYQVDECKVVNLDILDVYTSDGKFNRSFFESIFLKAKDKERIKLTQREEINLELNLEKVLTMKSLEQYIK